MGSNLSSAAADDKLEHNLCHGDLGRFYRVYRFLSSTMALVCRLEEAYLPGVYRILGFVMALVLLSSDFVMPLT